MIDKLFEAIFKLHPVMAVTVSAALVGLVGCFEYFVARSRRGAYLTWGVAAFGWAGAMILQYFR